MRKIFDRITNWVMCTFCTVHCVHSYKEDRLEYQVVSEVVTDRAIINKANRILGDAA